jgi:hypothetical protein
MDEQPDPPALARGNSGNRYPVPDPTTLTTEALRREVEALQLLVEQRIAALKELQEQVTNSLKQRSDEKELRLQEQLGSLETQTRDLIAEAMRSCDTQFEHVRQQFKQVEALRLEQKADTKAAVDAALTAQKEAVKEQTAAFREAVEKSDVATEKQIETIASAANLAREELRRRADENKGSIVDLERSLRAEIGKVDAKVNSATSARTGEKESKSSTYATIGVVVAILAVGLAVLGALAARGGP